MQAFPSEAARATVFVFGDEEFAGGLTASGEFETRDNGRWRATITMEPLDGTVEEEEQVLTPADILTYRPEAERGIRLLADAETTDQYELATKALLTETSSVGELATTDEDPADQAVDDILAELTTTGGRA